MRGNYEIKKRKMRELLRDLRKNAGIKQVELAARLKKPQSFVSKFESGEKNLDLLEVREICKVLEIPFIDFIQRLEEKFDES